MESCAVDSAAYCTYIRLFKLWIITATRQWIPSAGLVASEALEASMPYSLVPVSVLHTPHLHLVLKWHLLSGYVIRVMNDLILPLRLHLVFLMCSCYPD